MQNSQGSVMNALYRIANGAAEAMEFTVSPTTRYLNTPLKDLHLRLRNSDRCHRPRLRDHHSGGLQLPQAGDNVILISRNSGILDLNDIYAVVPIPGQEGQNEL